MKQADLLKRIEELERRVAGLEARPVYVPVYVPSVQTTPTYPSSPWWATPSLPYQVTWCGNSTVTPTIS